MGFDGAATFSGKKSGVQARMKKFAPHALFVHCHCLAFKLLILHLELTLSWAESN